MVLAIVEVVLHAAPFWVRVSHTSAIVERAHITQVDAHALCGIDAKACAHHVIGEVERKVIHEGIVKSVARDFP